jgi:hypothetical protein
MKRRGKTRRRIFRKKMRGGALADTIAAIIKFKNDKTKNTANGTFKLRDSPRSGGVQQLNIPYIQDYLNGITTADLENDINDMLGRGMLTEEVHNDGTVIYKITDLINQS